MSTFEHLSSVVFVSPFCYFVYHHIVPSDEFRCSTNETLIFRSFLRKISETTQLYLRHTGPDLGIFRLRRST